MTTFPLSWRDSSTRAKALLATGVVAALLFIFVGRAADTYWLRMVTKPIPVFCLALWVSAYPQRDSYRRWLIAGLLLCVLGDILLEASAATFLPGLVAFLTGHLAYIVMYTRDNRALRPWRAVAAFAYGALMFAFLATRGDLGAMTAPVAAYVVVIMTMVWRAAARVGDGAIGRFSAQIGLIGALLFAFSDTVLAINRFAVELPLAGTIVIITYWLGQTGIALSVVRDG